MSPSFCSREIVVDSTHSSSVTFQSTSFFSSCRAALISVAKAASAGPFHVSLSGHVRSGR